MTTPAVMGGCMHPCGSWGYTGADSEWKPTVAELPHPNWCPCFLCPARLGDYQSLAATELFCEHGRVLWCGGQRWGQDSGKEDNHLQELGRRNHDLW